MTQPPGPVIVMGHSMGGLLAAEAATHKMILESAPHPAKRRIVALVAFDTPYLGMHPHVVVRLRILSLKQHHINRQSFVIDIWD